MLSLPLLVLAFLLLLPELVRRPRHQRPEVLPRVQGNALLHLAMATLAVLLAHLVLDPLELVLPQRFSITLAVLRVRVAAVLHRPLKARWVDQLLLR